jgi:hypothetical protein
VSGEEGVLFEDFPSAQTLDLAARIADVSQKKKIVIVSSEEKGGKRAGALVWRSAWQPGGGGFVFVRKDAVDAVVDGLSKISL